MHNPLNHLPRRWSLLLLPFLALWAGCKPDPVIEDREGTFALTFLAQVGDQPFQGNTVHETVTGRKFSLEGFKLYTGDVTLVKENGEELLLSETELYDFVDDNTAAGVAKTFQVPVGNYRGLRFGIGVPADLNNGNPAVYAPDHPLSIQNGMHWNWTTGYIFVKIDGRIDSTAAMSGGPILGMTYHTGTNELYRDLSFLESDHAFEIKEGERLAFTLALDVNRIFYNSTDTLDMVTNNLTHSTPVGSDAFQLAQYLTDNLVGGAITKLPF